jgi:hypothetical protein
VDRSAQKALLTASSENRGNLAAGVLYHFHHCKSRHTRVSGVNEQLGQSGVERCADILFIDKRVMLACGLHMLFDRIPQVRDEMSRD